MNRYDLLSYASSFVSLLIKDPAIGTAVQRVLVFGSVARGDFDEESDIDVFIDIEDDGYEKRIRGRLDLFEASEDARKHHLEGIRNPISLRVGRLETWESLQSALAESAVTLYGPSSVVPKNMEGQGLFELDLADLERARKVKLWRALYGYSQKVGEKTYTSKGKVEMLGGTRLGRGVLLVPLRSLGGMTGFLNGEGVRYNVREVWLP